MDLQEIRSLADRLAVEFQHVVFFTGAGMSAESGVPTYRGAGGIWKSYDWQEYACQQAFLREPEKVLAFHEIRREKVLACSPHAGHHAITAYQQRHPQTVIVTQNIDGMHQRAGSTGVLELHGSLWRLLCHEHGIFEDMGHRYEHKQCPKCDRWLRPDITWFGDSLKRKVLEDVHDHLTHCDALISIGTSAVVWPAAGLPAVAKESGAFCLCINPEPPDNADLFDVIITERAGSALTAMLSH